MPGILIIGYGNRLRGDDAAGVLAARELKVYFRHDDEVEVVTSQQLTPEMAESIAHSSFVLFLDACNDQEPGSIQGVPVEPERQACGFAHHLTPASVLKLTQQIYGRAVPAMSLTLAGWSFAVDDELSWGVRKRLPEFIRQARETVATRRGLRR